MGLQNDPRCKLNRRISFLPSTLPQLKRSRYSEEEERPLVGSRLEGVHGREVWTVGAFFRTTGTHSQLSINENLAVVEGLKIFREHIGVFDRQWKSSFQEIDHS